MEILHQAIWKGNEELVRKMLKENKNLIYHINDDEWQSIHIAVSRGQFEIMKILIEEFNADVNAKTDYSYTPLLLAAETGSIEFIVELMKHNADTTLTDAMGRGIDYYLSQSHPDYKHITQSSDENTLFLDKNDNKLKVICYYIEYDPFEEAYYCIKNGIDYEFCKRDDYVNIIFVLK